VKHSQTGAAIANVSIATRSAYKDKKTDQRVETTEWHRVVFFNRLAEIVGEFLRKGSKVYIEGSLRTQKWQDKATGADRYAVQIIANEMQMLDVKQKGSGEQRREEQNPYLQAKTGSEPRQWTAGDSEQFQDDIPF
jgi:single-strand DNA-binding protein